MPPPSNEPRLDTTEIRGLVLKRLEKYKDLNVFEQFAMFMGMVQVLELGLKSLLVRRYNHDIETVEEWPLGKIKTKLKQHGLRPDFISLLESVVRYRNYIAHEFLVNDAILKCILASDSGGLDLSNLEKGIYELGQVMLLYDWCEEHNAWG